MSKDQWEERYSKRDRVWSKDPNHWLTLLTANPRSQSVESKSATKTPSQSTAACDVGCGEGADAIWLAKHAWQVTALDYSSAALARAESHAREAGVDGQIRWVDQDLSDWKPEPYTYDLVSVQFFHASRELREHVHQMAWRATRGQLLIVGHDPTNPREGNGGPPDPSVLYSAIEVVNALALGPTDQVLVTERRARNSDDPERIMWDSVVLIKRGTRS